MAMNLTQKERMLLNDQKTHEQVCIQKYQQYANQAQSAQLKQLFNSYAQAEQQHLNTINQILSGQVPNMQQGQQGGQGNMKTSAQDAAAMHSSVAGKASASQNDAALCTDMLMTEKYVSGAYDTAIFEFTDSNVRQALNHIQKEEQQHGEGIYQFMQSQGLYNVQQ